MAPEDYTSYEEIPAGEKNTYKPVNERGDFALRSAVEDSHVAERIARLENEAFDELESLAAERIISVEDMIATLGNNKLPYDEKTRLQEMLFQSADLARLKGHSIDTQLTEMLKKSYAQLQYSEVVRKKIIKGVEIGDVGVIGEVLKDEKMVHDFETVKKLTTDKQRIEAFAICKERLSSACSIIDNVEDVDVALGLYSEALSAANRESYSDKYALESSGKKLADKLFEAGAMARLQELLQSGIFQLSYYKDFIHRLSKEPQIIIDLIKNAKKVDDVYYALKFVTDPEILNSLAGDVAHFAHLNDEERGEVAKYSKNIAQALVTEPEVISLSELQKDKEGEYGNTKQPQNKFVVGVRNGKYVIAWSNKDNSEYHRNIFEKIGRLGVRSGGYVGIGEEDGKTIIRMVRSSGDYGNYSRELLEHYRNAIEKTLKDTLGERPFELVIKESSSYE